MIYQIDQVNKLQFSAKIIEIMMLIGAYSINLNHQCNWQHYVIVFNIKMC